MSFYVDCFSYNRNKNHTHVKVPSGPAGSELPSVLIVSLVDSHRGCRAQLTLTGSKTGTKAADRQRERKMDGTFHLPEVEQSQGSLLNLAEEEHLSGLRDHPAPSSSFQAEQTGLSIFHNNRFIANWRQPHLSFNVHPSIFPTLSISPPPPHQLSYETVCYTISLLGEAS